MGDIKYKTGDADTLETLTIRPSNYRIIRLYSHLMHNRVN